MAVAKLSSLSLSKEKLVFLLEHYSAQVQKEPRSKYFVPLAEVYRSLHLWDDAIQTLKKGLKHHATYIVGRALLAQVYFEKGEYLNASLEAEEVYAREPSHPLILKILSLSYFRMHDLEQSLFYLRRWLSTDPENRDALDLKKDLEHQKKTVSADVGDFKMINVADIKKIELLNGLLIKIRRRYETSA